MGSRYAGIHAIPVRKVVGSVGRGHELGVDFMPLRKPRRNHRFQSIYRLLEEGRALPAIEVYKVGDRYYVLDGHRRVAAALRRGQLELDAVVTEYRLEGGSDISTAA